MTLMRSLDISAAAMSVQRTRMNVAASNMANKNTTRTEEGGPYRRRDVVVQTVKPDFGSTLRGQLDGELAGVRVTNIVPSNDDPILIYDPSHPDADETGHVATPNISGIREMTNMMGASRAYEAGATFMKTVKEMAEQALRIGR